MEIKLTLPHPVSVNQAYAGMKVRFKSKKYKEWELLSYKATKDLILEIDKEMPIKANYVLYTPCYYKNGNHKRIDVSNYEKVTSDFLGHIITWFEDEYIYDIRQRKIDSERKEIDIYLSILTDENKDEQIKWSDLMKLK